MRVQIKSLETTVQRLQLFVHIYGISNVYWNDDDDDQDYNLFKYYIAIDINSSVDNIWLI